MLTAYFPQIFFDDYIPLLRQQIDERVTLVVGDDAPPRYEILVAGRPTEAQLDASPGLTHVIIPFAGMPEITRERLTARPHISLHNIHHNAPPTAEMAITLLMAAAKLTVPADRVFRTGDWSPRHDPLPAHTLNGKTALILGYGAIGQRVGAVCAALGMRVWGVKRRPPFDDNTFPPDQLAALLPQTLALIICLPLTESTRGMVGEAELALLPDDALVINVGRAAVVDEAALYHALKEHRLHAAGFDVWYRYPTTEAEHQNTFPSDYPFHELDNMVMSPHRAGGLGTEDTEVARMQTIAALINAVAAGQPVPNAVDLAAGY